MSVSQVISAARTAGESGDRILRYTLVEPCEPLDRRTVLYLLPDYRPGLLGLRTRIRQVADKLAWDLSSALDQGIDNTQVRREGRVAKPAIGGRTKRGVGAVVFARPAANLKSLLQLLELRHGLSVLS